MSERTDEQAETGTRSTDVGEQKRGTVGSSRGGTFGETPGEGGDKAEGPVGEPGAVPPHRQEE